ncbi:MAG: hypothetical protein HQL62_10680 [Magnetococcales bacterium]|nr:hypothetical protein [Magnetococcales bacterium]
MSDTVTLDEVWKLFRETARQIQDTERVVKELTKQMQDTDRKMQDTDRKMQDTDRKMQETDRKMQETDRKMRETDQQVQETSRVVKDVARQVGNLSSRWGEFVEGLVAPACEKLFAERGIEVRAVAPRIKAKLPGNRHMEIDILAIDTTVAILVEVKSKLKIEDVREHLERLAEFKEFFPDYAHKQVMGAVAAIVVDEEADRFAIKQGLFVIVQSGETVTLANADDFTPRIW